MNMQPLKEDVEIAGMTISRYLPKQSDAPRIVIVHGAMDTSSGFVGLAEELEEFEVLRYDRRGYGKNVHSANPPHAIEGHANDLLKIIGDQGAYVFAHSLGGIIAMRAASLEPHLIKGLIFYEVPLPWEDWWPAPVLPRQESPTQAEMDATVDAFLERLLGQEPLKKMSLEKRQQFHQWGPAWATELSDAHRNGPFFEYESISMPVVVSYGGATDDRHRKGAHVLSKHLGQASTVRIENGTHLAPHRQPQDLGKLVREFIREHQGASVFAP